MTHECIWTETEHIISPLSSEFYYERECDKEHVGVVENFCPNCGGKILAHKIDLTETRAWLHSVFNKEHPNK
jgi:ribosomal protein S27AE